MRRLSPCEERTRKNLRTRDNLSSLWPRDCYSVCDTLLTYLLPRALRYQAPVGSADLTIKRDRSDGRRSAAQPSLLLSNVPSRDLNLRIKTFHSHWSQRQRWNIITARTDSTTVDAFLSSPTVSLFRRPPNWKFLKAENQESQNVEVLFWWLAASSHRFFSLVTRDTERNNTDDNEQLVASRVPHGLSSVFIYAELRSCADFFFEKIISSPARAKH